MCEARDILRIAPRFLLSPNAASVTGVAPGEAQRTSPSNSSPHRPELDYTALDFRS